MLDRGKLGLTIGASMSLLLTLGQYQSQRERPCHYLPSNRRIRYTTYRLSLIEFNAIIVRLPTALQSRKVPLQTANQHVDSTLPGNHRKPPQYPSLCTTST